MGHPRLVHYASAVAALALLTGCDSWPKPWSRNDIEENAAEQATPDMSPRLLVMEERLLQVEAENRQLRIELNLITSAHDSLVATVNGNVRVANENARIANRNAGLPE